MAERWQQGPEPQWRWPANGGEVERRAQAIGRRHEVGVPVARMLAARGEDEESAERLLNAPTLVEAWQRMGTPPEIEVMAGFLAQRAVIGPVGILTDYDVDGATSYGILRRTLEAAFPGLAVPVAVPDRDREGFGPNPRALGELRSQGARTVITLDCGTQAGAVLDAHAQGAEGMQPAIVDHHPPRSGSAGRHALQCNPWARNGGPGPHTGLCTAGLAWNLGLALLRRAGWNKARSEGLRKEMTVLAGLGTVCDVMPLKGAGGSEFNRALVAKAVALADEGPAGVKGLLDAMEVEPGEVGEEDFGWRIGPALNAGARMGESALAAYCLGEGDRARSAQAAQRLRDLNVARKEKTRGLDRTLEGRLRTGALCPEPLSVAVLEEGSPGTAGIAAGGLVRRTGRPAVVLCPAANGSGQWTGSGRSALGLDLGTLVGDACTAGVARHGGGHAQACGVTVDDGGIGAFSEWMLREGRERLEGAAPVMEVDAVLHAFDVTQAALERIRADLERLRPFGQGHRTPVWGMQGVRVRRKGLSWTRTGHLLGDGVHEGVKIRFAWWRAPSDWPARLGLGEVNGDQVPQGRLAYAQGLAEEGRTDLHVTVQEDNRNGGAWFYVERARKSVE